jgi:predicted N-acetyltransferase YhbS
VIRPLLPDDVSAVRNVTWDALSELDVRTGGTTPELTPEVRRRGEARIAHLQRTDPGSCWVAEENGDIVGCSLALVREGMWFLSLLMVAPGRQGKGIGRQLLDAALSTATDCSWILSTVDPAALRRYQRAGFALHASYSAKGPVDRSRIPAVTGVQDGAYGEHAGLLEKVSRTVRGASIGPEVPYFDTVGARLLVVPDEGYAVLRDGGIATLAATNEDAARRLLWSAIAESGDKVEVDWLSANQQWAIDVCLDAHLALEGGASLCLRGQPAMSPYLPSGAFG